MNGAGWGGLGLLVAFVWLFVGGTLKSLYDHTRAIRALERSLTNVQSLGRVLCPHCLFPLSWVPWAAPAESSWWCRGCHQWINLESTRSSGLSKINSGRIAGSPNDHPQSEDTQSTQTHETGVAQG